MGMSRDEILGRCIWDLYPVTVGTRFEMELRRTVAEQKPSTFEYLYPPRDAWYENRLYPSTDGLSIFFVEITERKRAEERLATDLAGMRRLQEVSTQLVRDGDPNSLLLEIVDAAIAITSADMGNIQFLDRGSGALKIVASRGCEAPFLEFFDAVHEGQGSCGTAMRHDERTVVEDVTTSPIFVGTPSLGAVLAAGIRAVQSTPLVGRSGQVVGMLSTHYRTPRCPADRDLHVVDLLARQAADWIERVQAEEALRERGAVPAVLRTRPDRHGDHLAHQGDPGGQRRDLSDPRVLARRAVAEDVGRDDPPGRRGRRRRPVRPSDGRGDRRLYAGQAVGPQERPCHRHHHLAEVPAAEDGSVNYFVALLQDVTERKRADEALWATAEQLRRALEEVTSLSDERQVHNEQLLMAQDRLELERRRYEDLFDTAPDGYLVTDLYGTIRQSNSAAAHLLGVEVDRLRQKPLLAFIDPPARRSFRRRLIAGATGVAPGHWDVTIRPRGRPAFDASLSAAVVPDPESQTSTLRWLMRDISARSGPRRSCGRRRRLLRRPAGPRTSSWRMSAMRSAPPSGPSSA